MKRILSLLLVIAMLALVGCSGGETTTETTAATDATSAAENTTEAAGGGEEPVVLTMVMKDLVPSDPTHQAYIKMIEDGLHAQGVNVTLDVVEMPQGTYSENLSLMLLGGTIPDIIYFQGGDEQMADQGILEDLTPYVDGSDTIKNALLPYQKERLENYPYLIWIKPIANKVPVVRTDFLEGMDTGAALLQDPTVDNYYAFFKEMAEKNTSYAMTVPGALLEIDTIFNNAFGVTGTWIEQDGNYVYGKVTDMERSKLEFYAQLYQEGLLDPEYLTKAWDTKEQAFYSNAVGVISGTSGKVIDLYDANMKNEKRRPSNTNRLAASNGRQSRL